ncbi:MAG: hypothetical protein KBC30_09245 [Planctomycetes bacterium]|nr:hypothetical protein [Planctomycetota bacterium]HPY74615.1 hypothetical protein [Planctomycetota bacterium]HQB00255.1 hypothetical protein [Planctomycetota bacterium]
MLWGNNLAQSCSGEVILLWGATRANLLWGKEEIWQKRRDFSKFLKKWERFWKN